MIDKWVVLLNYNLASRCMTHITAFYQRADIGVFLVDNASDAADFAEIKRTALDMGGWVTDGGDIGANAAAIKQFVRSGGRIIVYRNSKNLGYAGGNNTALRLLKPILDGGGQFLVMNPDIEITCDAALQLLAHPAEICGPAIYEHYMKQVSKYGHDVDFATGFGTGHLDRKGTISCLSGACFKLSGDALERYGFLPDENFLYDEEIKYFERVHRLGGMPVYVPEIRVEHIGSLSVRKRSFTYYYYIFRNRLTYFKDVAGPRYGRYGRFTYLYVTWCLDVLYSNLKIRNWEGIRGIVCGVRDGLKGVSGPHVG